MGTYLPFYHNHRLYHSQSLTTHYVIFSYIFIIFHNVVTYLPFYRAQSLSLFYIIYLLLYIKLILSIGIHIEIFNFFIAKYLRFYIVSNFNIKHIFTFIKRLLCQGLRIWFIFYRILIGVEKKNSDPETCPKPLYILYVSNFTPIYIYIQTYIKLQ